MPNQTSKSSVKKLSESQKLDRYASFVRRNFWFRVGASKYGAGLFAVQDIPKGKRMVAGHPPGTFIPLPKNGKKIYNSVKDNMYKVDDFRKRGLTKTQIGLMQDFSCRGSNANNVPVPNIYSMLFPPMFQFSNHSEKPNVRVEGYHLVALRKIKMGEELFHDYREVCGSNELIY